MISYHHHHHLHSTTTSFPPNPYPPPPTTTTTTTMASTATATSFRSLRQSFHHHHHHHSFFTTSKDDFIFFKPITSYNKLSSSITTTNTTTTSPLSPSPSSTSLDLLAAHLASADYRKADDETRRLLIALAGEAAQTRGYVFFSEVQFISAADLQAIDQLWRQHSGGRFGYSVQRRLWEKCRRDFTKFFIKVVWMKKLDTEVEQFNYRSFPDEFVWELKEDTPEGHLPLTNALRGTQLLGCILTHPAFEEASPPPAEEEEAQAQKSDDGDSVDKVIGANIFKTDYSF